MCSPYVRKEANRLFWLVKGHLIPISEPDDVVEGYYDSYFKRLWNDESGCLGQYERGFEQAWKAREAEMYDMDIQKVAVLGGHYD